MREILFRGKRTDNGEWETGSLVIIRDGCSDKEVFIADKMTGYHTPVISETVGQYTGLTDKNGVKIFEGDIVRAFTRFSEIYVSPVAYHDGTFWFKNWSWTKFLFKFEKIEVIGNIHDNPELLETAAKPADKNIAQSGLAPATETLNLWRADNG